MDRGKLLFHHHGMMVGQKKNNVYHGMSQLPDTAERRSGHDVTDVGGAGGLRIEGLAYRPHCRGC